MTGRSRARDRSRPSGGTPAWTPKRLAGIAAWYRADLGVTGSSVSAWADQSGNARHVTQGTGANQPAFTSSVANLGGRPALTGDGTDILGSSVDVDLSSQWGFFCVFRLASLGNWRGIFRVSTSETGGTTADDGLVCYATSTGILTIADPGAGTSWYREAPAATVAADTGYCLIGNCATGNAQGITLDLGTRTGGTISWATLSLNRNISADCTPLSTGRYIYPLGGWSNASSKLVGDYAELGLRGTAWSAAEIAQLKAYFQRYA